MSRKAEDYCRAFVTTESKRKRIEGSACRWGERSAFSGRRALRGSTILLLRTRFCRGIAVSPDGLDALADERVGDRRFAFDDDFVPAVGGADAAGLAVGENPAHGLDHMGLAHFASHVADFDSGADHDECPKQMRMDRILSRSCGPKKTGEARSAHSPVLVRPSDGAASGRIRQLQAAQSSVRSASMSAVLASVFSSFILMMRAGLPDHDGALRARP